jgi:hypothetical protein
VRFDLHPNTYPVNNSRRRVLTIGDLLRGDAKKWFNPIYERNDAVLDDYQAFLSSFETRFKDPNRASNAAARLKKAKQGSASIAAFASTFQLDVTDAGWDDAAAQDAFKCALNDVERDLLMTFKKPANLEELIAQANEAHNRILERRREQGTVPSKTRSVGDVQPMELDALITQRINAVLAKTTAGRTSQRGPIDAATRKHRLDNGLCMYGGCSPAEHAITADSAACPKLLARNAHRALPGNVAGRG